MKKTSIKSRLLLILALVALLIIACLTMSICYAQSEQGQTSIAEESTEFNFQDYIKNKIAPNIILALTTITTILVGTAPAWKQVVSASKLFSSASSNIEATSKSSEAIKTAVSGGIGEIKQILTADNTTKAKQISALERKIEKQNDAIYGILNIVKIAFTNSAELANSGYASQIESIASQIEYTGDDEEGGGDDENGSTT